MLNNSVKFKSPGFTLIETLVSLSILIVITFIGTDFIRTGFKASVFLAEQDMAVQNARRALEYITKELRGANLSELGDYPLSVVEEDNIVFYSDMDDDNEYERIRYFSDNHKLFRVITQPGPLFDYNMPGATTTVAEYLFNQETPIFTYYDGNNNETDVVNQIRLIGVEVTINVTPERAPYDYTVYTKVNLRNLKDNL